MTTRLLFVDTETGGLDPFVCSLLSLGLVVWEDGVIRGKTEIFVAEPEIVADAESRDIHGIDIVWLKSHGLPPAAAVDQLETFVATYFDFSLVPVSVPIAGHNVGFDISFLRRLYRLAGRDYGQIFSHRTLDTAGILRFLSIAGVLQLEGAGSSAAFEHFGIAFGAYVRHSALGDAHATAVLFTKLVDLVRQPVEVRG
jgi:DNA polymerase-3 subunit epsilon